MAVFSILDLCPITEGSDAFVALRNPNSDIHQFPNDVVELQQYFKEPRKQYKKVSKHFFRRLAQTS